MNEIDTSWAAFVGPIPNEVRSIIYHSLLHFRSSLIFVSRAATTALPKERSTAESDLHAALVRSSFALQSKDGIDYVQRSSAFERSHDLDWCSESSLLVPHQVCLLTFAVLQHFGRNGLKKKCTHSFVPTSTSLTPHCAS